MFCQSKVEVEELGKDAWCGVFGVVSHQVYGCICERPRTRFRA